MTFAQKIKTARAMKDLTHEQLSALTGISRQTLISYEKGRSRPRAASCIKLASALGVSYAYLTDDEQTDPNYGAEKTGYIETAHGLYGVRGAREIEQLLDANRALFAGGELSQDEKNAFFDAVMDAYLTSKKEARRRFSPAGKPEET